MVFDLGKTSFLIPDLVIRLILGMGARCIFPCQIHLYLWLLVDALEEEKTNPNPKLHIKWQKQ